MIEKTVTEMDQEEFDALIDAYIDRAAGTYGEMAVDIFLNPLLERAAAKVEATPLIQETPGIRAQPEGNRR